MTGKRDVGKEEMLDYLGRWKHCSQADQCSPAEMMKCIEVEDAIRAAISEYFRLREKVGKLGKRANELYESHHRSAPFSLTKFIMEIRDFGEGE